MEAPPTPTDSRLTSPRPFSALATAWWLDLLLVALLLLAALPFRLVNLDTAAAKSDEGIRLAQLFLMSVGYRPIRDIFASQGPLSLDVTYPLFALLGGTLAAARLAVVAYSLAELAACYALARAILPSVATGRLAGLLTGLLLVLSPVYLKNSRTALVEVPALLPATLAILAAVRFAAGGRRAWLLASAVLLAVALLIKPMVLAAGLPVLLALLARPTGRWRNLALAAGAGGGVLAGVVLLYGPTELYDQVIRYRAGSAAEEGWSLAGNVDMLRPELDDESPAWLALALLAIPLGLWRLGWRALPPVSWALASAALLLLYTPVAAKHAVIVLPAIAVLVGCALAASLRRPSPGAAPSSFIPHPSSFIALGLLLWYLASLPTVLARDRQVAHAGTQGRDAPYAEDVRLLTGLTGPDEFVVLDEPYLAYLSRRRVPPSLVDPTEFRLRSGTLTATEVIDAAASHQARALLLLSDGLRDLKRFGDWVDANYRPVRIWERANRKDRALYLRNDADFAAARVHVRGDLPPIAGADFAGQLRLAAATVEPAELRPGATINVTSEWEALAPPAVDFHVLGILRGPDGQTVVQVERTLGGGGAGTAVWQPGRWTVRTFALTVPPRTPPGDYTLALALYDSKARGKLPLTTGTGSSLPDEIPIGTIRLRSTQ